MWEQTARQRPTNPKEFCSNEVFYTKFVYLVDWEASEVLTPGGHWETYGLSCRKDEIVWISTNREQSKL